ELQALGGGAEVADVDDVLMANARRRARLLHEALAEVDIASELAVQDLEGDLLHETVEGGEVDRAHAALAQLLLDEVAAGERGTEKRIVLRRQVRRASICGRIGRRRGGPGGRGHRSWGDQRCHGA